MSLSHNNSIYLFMSIMKEPIFCRTKWKTEIQFPVNHLTSSYPVTTLETWISWHLFVGLLKCYCGRVGLLFFISVMFFCNSYGSAYSSAVSVVACKILVSNCSKVLIPIAIIPYLAIFIWNCIIILITNMLNSSVLYWLNIQF